MKNVIMLICCAVFLIAFTDTTFCEEKTGVIVVDVQGDFTTWKKGSLAVTGTDNTFVAKVQKSTKKLKDKGYIIFGTQDWHPADHISFYTNHPGKNAFEAIKIGERTQVLWPPHCIQGTENAKVLVDNNLFLAIVKKGKDSAYDSYSGFQDDGGQKTELTQVLKRNGIKKVVVYGIATDYCVKATAIDAAIAGFKVIVIDSLCRGVAPDTSTKALEEMEKKGILILKKLDLDKIKQF